LNTDQDLLIFRRFGCLSVRNILYLQDRLSKLEERLAERDAAAEHCDTRRHEDDQERAKLVVKSTAPVLENAKVFWKRLGLTFVAIIVAANMIFGTCPS